MRCELRSVENHEENHAYVLWNGFYSQNWITLVTNYNFKIIILLRNIIFANILYPKKDSHIKSNIIIKA